MLFFAPEGPARLTNGAACYRQAVRRGEVAGPANASAAALGLAAFSEAAWSSRGILASATRFAPEVSSCSIGRARSSTRTVKDASSSSPQPSSQCEPAQPIDVAGLFDFHLIFRPVFLIFRPKSKAGKPF